MTAQFGIYDQSTLRDYFFHPQNLGRGAPCLIGPAVQGLLGKFKISERERPFFKTKAWKILHVLFPASLLMWPVSAQSPF